MKKSMKIRQQLIPLTLERISYIKELVNSIKPVKMYAWERALKEKIQHVRDEELTWLKRSAFIQTQSSNISAAVPLAATILTYITLA